MRKEEKKLLIEQTDRKLSQFDALGNLPAYEKNWIFVIRRSLGMTLLQLAKRLGTSKQNVQNIEKREADGKVTVENLSQIAEAMDCRFVYAFVPKEGSVKKTIERRANEIAAQIVMRTSQTMKLEDQENSPERINTAIKELSEKIISEMPKYLWD
jgi:predicted DNA-binding mobile mystery protein A